MLVGVGDHSRLAWVTTTRAAGPAGGMPTAPPRRMRQRRQWQRGGRHVRPKPLLSSTRPPASLPFPRPAGYGVPLQKKQQKNRLPAPSGCYGSPTPPPCLPLSRPGPPPSTVFGLPDGGAGMPAAHHCRRRRVGCQRRSPCATPARLGNSPRSCAARAAWACGRTHQGARRGGVPPPQPWRTRPTAVAPATGAVAGWTATSRAAGVGVRRTGERRPRGFASHRHGARPPVDGEAQRVHMGAREGNAGPAGGTPLPPNAYP